MQFNIKDQSSIGWNNTASATRAIAHLCRNDQRAFTANLHASDTFIPTLDDMSGAQGEAKELAAI